MTIKELKPGDFFTLISQGIQYEYDGYKNYHRMGFMHWVIKDGVKMAYSHKTLVNRI